MRVLVDRAGDRPGVVQGRLEAQGDDIDGVTWVTLGNVAATPGTILQVRLDEVVDDYDFAATAIRVLDAPVAGRAPKAGRVLPVAPGSVGSFGR